MWEKKKLLVMSNFSFPTLIIVYCVFKRYVLQARKKKGLFGERLRLVGLYVPCTHPTAVLELSGVHNETRTESL